MNKKLFVGIPMLALLVGEPADVGEEAGEELGGAAAVGGIDTTAELTAKGAEESVGQVRETEDEKPKTDVAVADVARRAYRGAHAAQAQRRHGHAPALRRAAPVTVAPEDGWSLCALSRT